MTATTDFRTLTIAKACHAANASWAASHGDESHKPWDKAPEWQRNAAIEQVVFHMANPLAGPSAAHRSWMDQKTAEGWEWGKVKDDEKKTHPAMVPFHLLPPEEQAKDRMFVAIVKALSQV